MPPSALYLRLMDLRVRCRHHHHCHCPIVGLLDLQHSNKYNPIHSCWDKGLVSCRLLLRSNLSTNDDNGNNHPSWRRWLRLQQQQPQQEP